MSGISPKLTSPPFVDFFLLIVEVGTMEPTVSGGAICHGKFAIEWLGVVFDDIYPDTGGESDAFKDIQSGSKLKVGGYFKAPGTTSVGESSDSLGASIGSIHNGWTAEGAKV